jgi:hypothetical protein
MSLFRCENPDCETLENTALSMCYWASKKKLCSACCSTQTKDGGKWHGIFKQRKATKKDEIIN